MLQFEFPPNFKDIGQEIKIDLNFEQKSEKHIKTQFNNILNNYNNHIDLLNKKENFELIINILKAQEKKSFSIELLELIGDKISQIIIHFNSQLQNNQRESQRVQTFIKATFISMLFLQSTCFQQKSSQNQTSSMAFDNLDKKKAKQKNISEKQPELMKVQREILQSIVEICKLIKVDKEILVQEDRFYTLMEDCVQVLLNNRHFLEDEKNQLVLLEIIDKIVQNSQENKENMQKILIQIIYENEELMEIIGGLLCRWTKQEYNQILSELMQEIVELILKKTNLSYECQAIKNVSRLLIIVSEQVPKVFNTNIQVYLQLYDSESYLMRNTVSDILYNISKNLLTKDINHLDETQLNSYNKNKLHYINILINRLTDKNSLARNHTLHIFINFINNNLIPSHILLTVFQATILRINDCSSLVRKKAMQFINQLIKVFYQLFVQNQNRTTFLTIQQINLEIQLSNQYINQTKNTLKEQENILKSMTEEQEEEFDILKEQHDQLKQKIVQQNKVVFRLQEYEQLIIMINSIVGKLTKMLQSKNNSDVIESIKLLVILRQQQIEESEQGIQKMLGLIWIKDDSDQTQSIKNELYFKDNNPIQVANNLVSFISTSNQQDAASFQQLFSLLFQSNEQKFNISKEVNKSIWQIFVSSQQQNDKIKFESSIKLIRIICENDNQVFQSQLHLLNSIINKQIESKQVNWFIVQQVALILQTKQKDNEESTKLISKQIFYLLIKHYDSYDNSWFMAAESIIDMIFIMIEQPEIPALFIIKKIAHCLFTNIDDIENGLAKVIFLVGHVSLKILIMIDELESKLKKMKLEKEENDHQRKQKIDETNNELDQIQGGLEGQVDQRIDRLQQILNEDILASDHFLGEIAKVIIRICQDIHNNKRGEVTHILDKVSILAFAKIMCVSKTFCQQHLNLFLQLMNRTSSGLDSSITINLLISFGDILKRFPNQVELKTNHLYQNLKSTDLNVKKTSLMVITHLILNDMLKLKSELSDLALLLVDPNPYIQNLIRLFFHELNKKDNNIIKNLLPESIGKLSQEEDFSVEQFQIFANVIMSYLEQEKYSEILVNKLCQRIKNSILDKEVVNSAYCLTLLNYNEKAVRKLLVQFEDYRDKLSNQVINEHFKNIILKIKKIQKNTEIKLLADELEEKIKNYLTAEINKDNYIKKKAQSKKAIKNKIKKKIIDYNESDNSDDLSFVSDFSASKKIQQNQSKNKNENQRNLRIRNKNVIFEEESSDQEEMEQE